MGKSEAHQEFSAAIVEQLKRIADAGDRQATAVERRNELLEHLNADNRTAQERYILNTTELLNHIFRAMDEEKTA